MSLFTLNKNNLGDLEDLKKARKNLGLGTIAIQESNDVTIDGGHISIKDFQLRNTHGLTQVEGMFMVSDENGYAYWREYDSIRENSNLRLSGFCNDAPFATVDEVAQRLRSDKNLGDLTNVGHAISNLGLARLLEENDDGSLDPIAYRNLYNAKANNLRTSNLIVTDDLDIRNQIRLTYLNEDDTLQNGNFLRIDTQSDTIQAVNLSSNIEDNHEHTAPTSFLLNSIYNELSNVNYVSFSNIDAKLDRITVGSNYLEQLNNLSDVRDKAAALSNLGLDGLTTVDNRLTVSNIQINTGFRLGTSTNDGHVLMCDAEGNGDWSEFPAATYNRRGTVNIATSYLQEDVNGKTFVPTSSVLLNAFNTLSNTFVSSRPTNISAFTNDAQYLTKTNYFSEFQTREEKKQALINLDIFTEDIANFPSGVSAFQNDVGYLKLADKLTGFNTVDLPIVRSNLGLAEVAQTGDYNSLCNIPTHLDYSTLTEEFLVKSSNLSDIDNLDLVRTNLGLREMAFYDRNNVSITGGVIYGLNSITTNELIVLPALEPNYTSTEYVNDIIFLKATSSSGTGSWGRIPTASTTNKGVVQLSEDINSTGNDIVYGSIVLRDKLSVMTSNIDTLTANQNNGNSLELQSTLSVHGSTTLVNTLSVHAPIFGSDTLHIKDNVFFGNNLSVAGSINVSSNLTVNNLIVNGESVGGGMTELPSNIYVDSVTASNFIVHNNILPSGLLTDSNINIGENNNRFHSMYIDNLYYGNNNYTFDELDTSQPPIPYEKKLFVLDHVTGKAVWMSSGEALNNVTSTTIQYNEQFVSRVNHLEVFDTIYYEAGDSEDILRQSFMTSDTYGKMVWNSNLQMTESNNGLVFQERMTIFHENDQIIIGKYTSNPETGVTVVNKHIFR